MRLLITRAREDAEELAALLAARGVETLLDPLISITDVEGADLALDGVRALLITSANGIRAFARREQGRGLAVYAVGDGSARAARALGFENVSSAAGDVEALAALVRATLDPDQGALLHVAATHVAGDLSGLLREAGFRVRREVLYEAVAARQLNPETRESLEKGGLAGVLLFSPRTAGIFARLAVDAGLADACGALSAYCLSPAVAGKIEGLPWRRVVVAAEPNQEALLRAMDPPGD